MKKENNKYHAIDTTNMPEITVSDETYNVVRHFKKVIDAVLGEEMENMDDYVEFILQVGMTKMLMDILPEEEALRDTMAAMFKDNPEYVCSFIARTLKNNVENVKKSKDEWRVAYQ